MSDGPISKRPIVIAFWLYAIALFIATHYPKLAIDSPINNTDKAIHLVAFGLWTILCGLAFRFHVRAPARQSDAPTLAEADPEARIEPPQTARPGSFLRLPVIASLYAIADESLQAIPALGRTFSLADMIANLLGVLGGTLLILLIRLKIAARPRS